MVSSELSLESSEAESGQIRQLPPANIFCKLCDSFVIEPAEDVKIENVIRFESGIRFKFSQPVAVLVLK